MNKLIAIGCICCLLASCKNTMKKTETNNEFVWQIDKFDDIRIIRYQIPGFEELTPKQKELVYYLSEATLCGRDILWDQNYKYNLLIRSLLESVYSGYKGDRNTADFKNFEKYLKKVWFANGIHHHYSTDKFVPEFSAEYFDELIKNTPSSKMKIKLDEEMFFNAPGVEQAGDYTALHIIRESIFNPAIASKRVNQDITKDLVVQSACNFYEGVSQKEVEAYYAAMSVPNDPTPVSYGLNSKVVKDIDGQINEAIWKIDGMYTAALEKVVYWLNKAINVAENPQQRQTLQTLVRFYEEGELKDFDAFNILWVNDTLSSIDYVNGFTETYGDPLGLKASWEGIVNFKNIEATKRTQLISDNAQWFEDHSPVDPQYRKENVKGVSAKVITVAMLGGDCYPSTPIGINLPNADWIRKDHGSKSVTIENITYAYAQSSLGNGSLEEFAYSPEEIARSKEYGSLGSNLNTDLHECLGHGSGQLAPGIKGDELRNYGSPLEEARASLFALYYIADPQLIKLGLIPNLEVAKAEYDNAIRNGLMTQLTRIQPGKTVEQAHMRCRQLMAAWAYDLGKAENVIEKKIRDGKTYFVVNDYDKLRTLFGEMLKEVQRIKSEGDYEAGRDLIEKYAVQIDENLHREVLERYQKLNLAPYGGFVNPVLTPEIKDGVIVDVKPSYTEGYAEQMLRYSDEYGFLPTLN